MNKEQINNILVIIILFLLLYIISLNSEQVQSTGNPNSVGSVSDMKTGCGKDVPGCNLEGFAPVGSQSSLGGEHFNSSLQDQATVAYDADETTFSKMSATFRANKEMSIRENSITPEFSVPKGSQVASEEIDDRIVETRATVSPTGSGPPMPSAEQHQVRRVQGSVPQGVSVDQNTMFVDFNSDSVPKINLNAKKVIAQKPLNSEDLKNVNNMKGLRPCPTTVAAYSDFGALLKQDTNDPDVNDCGFGQYTFSE